MARVALTPQQIALTGLTPTFTAPTDAGAGGGWSFPNTGDTFIRIKNTGGAQRVVTLLTPATIGGVAISDPTVTIPATTGDILIGPFDPSLFNQSDGAVYVEVDATTGLTAAAITL